jgi:two-component system, LuxR family, sensor histidine kinase DctS
MDPNLVDLARRLAAGDPTARAELTTHPGEMARALDEMLTSLERRTALLAETEQYFRALTEQSLVGICVLARDRVLFANEALATMVGYSVHEVLGLADPLDIVHPEDRPTVIRNLERRFRGETFRAAFRMLRKGGGTVLVEADGRRVVRRGEPVIIGSFVRGDASRRSSPEARKERQALFRSEKMATLGELLSGLAHELSNPLMVTMTQANLIERSAGAGPVAERAHTIAGEADRAAQIVRRVTSFVRDFVPENRLLGLNDVVREVVELFGHTLRSARIDVALALADELPSIWADTHRIHELVAHLLANSVQAMRGRPAPRRVTIRTAALPGKPGVALEVSDTGPGVSAEIRPNLFEPFFSTKPPGVGTGLGLFVCQEIARDQGGSIGLLERSGPGATFRVELPERAPAAR